MSPAFWKGFKLIRQTRNKLTVNKEIYTANARHWSSFARSPISFLPAPQQPMQAHGDQDPSRTIWTISRRGGDKEAKGPGPVDPELASSGYTSRRSTLDFKGLDGAPGSSRGGSEPTKYDRDGVQCSVVQGGSPISEMVRLVLETKLDA